MSSRASSPELPSYEDVPPRILMQEQILRWVSDPDIELSALQARIFVRDAGLLFQHLLWMESCVSQNMTRVRDLLYGCRMGD